MQMRGTCWREPRWLARDTEAAEVLRLVAQISGVPVDRIVHPDRLNVESAAARHLAMYLLHTVKGRQYEQVGRIFGRSRAAVTHACARVEDRRDDPQFDTAVAGLEARLAGGTRRVA